MMLALLAVLFLQDASVVSKDADDLRSRAVVEPDGGGRITVTLDGVTLYQGPGVKAKVDVLAVEKFPGRKFVTVSVDGGEEVRLLAKSLAKPVKLPSSKPSEDVFLRVVTEDESITILLIARPGDSIEIFECAKSAGKPELFGPKESIEVRLGGTVIYRARRVKGPPKKSVTVADFIERLNVHRRAAGVPEVNHRLDLSRACDLHALYLAKNAGREETKGLKAHTEDPKLPGYSEEGARAGTSSVIHYFGISRDLTDSVDSLMATLYHRVQMLDPRLETSGVGWAFDRDGASVVVMHIAMTTGAAGDEPVASPGADQKDVPLEFGLGGRETPDPVPAESRGPSGYPITIQFPWVPKEITARLLLDGKEVECWLSTPQRPARGDWPQPKVACLIPKKPLEAVRTYTVEAAAKKGDVAWTKTWGFTTAKK